MTWCDRRSVAGHSSTSGLSKDAARDFVKTLPRQDRLMVMLRYAEGLSLQEVSMVLELGYATVQRRMAELEEEVRQVLEAQRGSVSKQATIVVDEYPADARSPQYDM